MLSQVFFYLSRYLGIYISVSYFALVFGIVAKRFIHRAFLAFPLQILALEHMIAGIS